MRTRGKAKKDGLQFRKGEGSLFTQMELMQQSLEQGVPESHYFTQRPETESEESEGEPEEPPTVLEECPRSDESSDDESTASERAARAADFLYSGNQDVLAPIVEGGGAVVVHVKGGFLSKPLDCTGILSRIKREEEEGFTPSPNVLMDRSQTDKEPSAKPNFAKDHSAEAVLEGRRQGEVAKAQAGRTPKVVATTDSRPEMLECLNEENAIDAARAIINREAQESHGKAYGEPTEPIGAFKAPPEKILVPPPNPPKRKIMDNPYTQSKSKRKPTPLQPQPPARVTGQARLYAPKPPPKPAAVPKKGLAKKNAKEPEDQPPPLLDVQTGHLVPIEEPQDDEKEFDISEIADMMNESGYSAFGEVADMVENCDRGGNTKETEARKESLLRRMIDTIAETKENWTVPMLKKVNCRYLQAKGDFTTLDYALYDYLSGEKTIDKRAIMNRIVTLCGIKWKKLRGRKGTVGKDLQPSAHIKNIRNLLAKLRERGIDYKHSEFTDKGEFAGIMATKWHNIRQNVDSSFGTDKEQRRVDEDYIPMLLKAIEDGRLDPMNNAEHLIWLIIFCLGYYCCFRGGKDHIQLQQDEVTFGVFDDSFGPEWTGKPCVIVTISESKATRLSVTCPRIKKGQRNTFYIPQEAPLVAKKGWIPYTWFLKYKSHQHPKARRFYCQMIQSEKTRAEVNAQLQQEDIEFNRLNPYNPRMIQNYDVRYHPGQEGKGNYNLGANSISGNLKSLAKFIGIKDFELATGQAMRALALGECARANLNQNDAANFARQANVSVQGEYVGAANKQRIGNQLNAISIASVAERKDQRMGIKKKKDSITKREADVEVEDEPPAKRLASEVNMETEMYKLKAEKLELELKLLKAEQNQNHHQMSAPVHVPSSVSQGQQFWNPVPNFQSPMMQQPMMQQPMFGFGMYQPPQFPMGYNQMPMMPTMMQPQDPRVFQGYNAPNVNGQMYGGGNGMQGWNGQRAGPMDDSRRNSTGSDHN